MPLPNIFGRESRANRNSTASPSPPTSSGRPQISNPLGPSVVHQRQLDPRTTITLVPAGSSASQSPVSSTGGATHGSSSIGELAADVGSGGGGGGGNGVGNGGASMEDNSQQQHHLHHHHHHHQPISSSSSSASATAPSNYISHRQSTNLLGLQQQQLLNNTHSAGLASNPSSSSSSVATLTGAPQSTTTTTRERRNPVVSLFTGGRDRNQNHHQHPPPSPDISSVSRRLSLRGHHLTKHQPPPSPSPVPQQPSPLQQHLQPGATQYPPPPSHPQNDNIDPYLQRPGTGRPQSVLPTPHEEPTNNPLGIDTGHQQYQQQPYGHPLQAQQNYSRVSLVSQTSHQQQQQGQHPQHLQQGPPPQTQYYVDPAAGQQQGYNPEQDIPPEYQHHQQHQPQHHCTQEENMPRPSSESQNMQQQIYAQRGNVQEAYNGAGAGRGGQTYDHNQQPVGRSTPNQGDNRAGAVNGPSQSELDLQQALDELTSLQGKYRKVKSLYFEQGKKIERLQNALVHQRLSQSRSSLDDQEYTARFDRLDGAIKNVAYELRQSWKEVPLWLQPYINFGAHSKGGREMVIVGRASIARWVVDEIIEEFFHPCLDQKLSSQLKAIERNIRITAPELQSVEEDDALSAKICSWRLTTLDAIQSQITGPQANQNRQLLCENLVKKLVSDLMHHLHEPAPEGLLKGCQMIVEIAVGLASNLPMESRDVRVFYPVPGTIYESRYMKIELQLPPLPTPPESDPNQMEVDFNDANSQNTSTNSTSAQDPGNQSTTSTNPPADSSDTGKLASKGKSSGGGSSGGVLGRARRALQGNQQQPPTQPQPPTTQQPGQAQQAPPSPGPSTVPPTKPEEPQPDRVRVAGFMAVEVRGRSILVKAPVCV